MRIGIVTDIHDHFVFLEKALDRFRELRVDQVVSLGDAFETFRPGEPGVEVARILNVAGAVGVWGNHDIGLSYGVSDEVRRQADGRLLDFAATLKPQLVIAGCRFSHVEPEIDSTHAAKLWRFHMEPESAESSLESLDACPEQFLFMGHYHEWLVTNEEGMVPFDGSMPLRFDDGARYRIMVNAVIRGWAAMFDTTTRELTPVRLRGQGETQQ